MKKLFAIIFVASMALFTLTACGDLNQSLHKGMMEGYVELANEDLPEEIDEGYTLDKVECIDNVVIYHYTITSELMEGFKLIEESEMHDEMLNGLSAGYADEDQKKFIDIVIKAQGDIKYIWTDETGEEYEVLIPCDELKSVVANQ